MKDSEPYIPRAGPNLFLLILYVAIIDVMVALLIGLYFLAAWLWGMIFPGSVI